MQLFHCFPRIESTKKEDESEIGAAGLGILRSILRHGLLCSHEELQLDCDPLTERLEKALLLSLGEPVDSTFQSRASFTLCELDDLAQEVNRTPFTPLNDPQSHGDSFGQFAVALCPIEARRLGIVPTKYYYRFLLDPYTVGLSNQIVHRLMELRAVCSLLSLLEARVGPIEAPGVDFPDALRLRRDYRLNLDHEGEAKQMVDDLSLSQARLMYQSLNTDRVPAVDLLDFLDLLLSAYQNSDSTKRHSPLEFYLQKEWRALYHRRDGLEWVRLLPRHNEQLSASERSTRSEVRRLLERKGRRSNEYFAYCNVLSKVDGRPFRNLVKKVIVPRFAYQKAEAIVKEEAPGLELVIFPSD